MDEAEAVDCRDGRWVVRADVITYTGDVGRRYPWPYLFAEDKLPDDGPGCEEDNRR